MTPEQRAERAKTWLANDPQYLDPTMRAILEQAASPDYVAKEKLIAAKRRRSCLKWALIVSGTTLAACGVVCVVLRAKGYSLPQSAVIGAVVYSLIGGFVFGWVFGRTRW